MNITSFLIFWVSLTTISVLVGEVFYYRTNKSLKRLSLSEFVNMCISIEESKTGAMKPQTIEELKSLKHPTKAKGIFIDHTY